MPEFWTFINKYGLDLGIERVAENPMGPAHWQEGMIHYALWVTCRASGEGVPLFFSFDKRLAEPGPYLFPEAVAPSMTFMFAWVARVVASHSRGLAGFIELNDLFHDPEGAAFYFEHVGIVKPTLERLLTRDGLKELIDLGNQDLNKHAN